MSSYGASIWEKDHPYPTHKGKVHQPYGIKPIGQPTQHPQLKARMKADDSDAVNMTDSKLGGGIRLTGSTK